MPARKPNDILAELIADVTDRKSEGVFPGLGRPYLLQDLLLSLDGSKGLINPNPGAQRLLGLPTLMATPPTITQGGSGVASTIASAVGINSVAHPSGFVVDSTVPWRYLGCTPVVGGQSFPDQQYVLGSNVNGIIGSGGLTVEFEFDGITFDYWVKGTANYWRIMVDGQYVTALETAGPAADGGSHQINVAFAARANRRIRIEFSANTSFGGLKVGPNDTVWKSSFPVGPLAVFMGDSFTEGTGTASGFGICSWQDTMGKSLGWQVRNSGKGATGFLNPGTSVDFLARLVTDVINPNPEIVVFAGGINDTGFTKAQIQARALLVFAQTRAALPNVKMISFGPWWPSGSPTQAVIDTRDAIRAALADPTVTTGPTLLIDNIGASVPGANALGYMTGTGKVGATTGSGNADIYTNNGGTHPPQAGHDYLGRRGAADVAASMPL